MLGLLHFLGESCECGEGCQYGNVGLPVEIGGPLAHLGLRGYTPVAHLKKPAMVHSLMDHKLSSGL